MPALTFRAFQAGLNNQKLALLGLALVARKQGRPVSLPMLVDYRLGDDQPALRPLDTVLDRSTVADGLARFGVAVIHDLGDALDPNELIARGGEAIAASRRANDGATFDGLCRLLAAMAPAPEIAARATRIAAELDRQAIDTGCQMRIENDWRHWSALHRADARIDVGERLYLDHAMILADIAVSLPQVRSLYVTCDESDLPVPVAAIRDHARATHDIRLVFRSDLPVASVQGSLAGAALDFAIALALPRFVGHTRSSFFGLVGLTAHGVGRTVEHWLYNNRGDFLKRRTDQGAFVRPWAAAHA